jgi:hypothetical protein
MVTNTSGDTPRYFEPLLHVISVAFGIAPVLIFFSQLHFGAFASLSSGYSFILGSANFISSLISTVILLKLASHLRTLRRQSPVAPATGDPASQPVPVQAAPRAGGNPRRS